MQVPDVFQIIVKEKGVFTNVTSPTTKAKLRVLFEVAPLALLVRHSTPLYPKPSRLCGIRRKSICMSLWVKCIWDGIR